MKEIWKDVTGFAGIYKVSNFGRILSLPRMRKGRYGLVRKGGREIKGWEADGYRYITLRWNIKESKTEAIHRIVLTAFVGECPPNMECRHLDGNRSNNRLSNLQWGTDKENMKDRNDHGKHARGSSSVRAKLTEKDIPLIRKLLTKHHGEWGLLTNIAKKFNVTAAAIFHVRNGNTWSHVP